MGEISKDLPLKSYVHGHAEIVFRQAERLRNAMANWVMVQNEYRPEDLKYYQKLTKECKDLIMEALGLIEDKLGY